MTAFGGLYDSAMKVDRTNIYGTDLIGLYALEFTWRNVEADINGFDFLAENGLGPDQAGSGTGTVRGTSFGTAFQSSLNVSDWTGKYDYTLDAKSRRSPDALGWLTVDGGQHDGDYGFNMTPVPEPSTFALFGLGLGFLSYRFHRKKRSS